MVINLHIPDGEIDELIEQSGGQDLLLQACVTCGDKKVFTEVQRYPVPLKWEDEDERDK